MGSGSGLLYPLFEWPQSARQNTANDLASVNASPQHIQHKVQRARYNVFATPFYSLLSNIRVTAPGINPDNTTYNTPALLNSVGNLWPGTGK